MENTVFLNSVSVVNADSLQYIKTLPDNCIDLIATDPPYFRVKSCRWDNQWESEQHYLSWLEDLLTEFWRVLKPSGSLYMFCGSRLAADTELLVRSKFDVLSHIVWAKPHGTWKRQNKESLRAFFPSTERIIFASHYRGPYKPKNDGWSEKLKEIRQQIFRPLIDYFRTAKNELAISSKTINLATGTSMAGHWFGKSQWQLPNEINYGEIQALFESAAKENGKICLLDKPYSEVFEKWSELEISYKSASKDYEYLRRPFALTSQVPYTDVWTYAPVAYYPGKHPCEKPAEMMEHIIKTSSRPGEVVADFFMGSGATLKAAVRHGRKALGVELEQERFEKTSSELLG